MNTTLYIHTQNKTKQNKTKQNKTKQNKTKQNKTKRKQNKTNRFKLAAKWPLFTLHFHFGEKLKKKKTSRQTNKQTNNFPKEFVNEIWLMIGDHKYINIAEIEIESFYSGGILGAKHSCTPC